MFVSTPVYSATKLILLKTALEFARIFCKYVIYVMKNSKSANLKMHLQMNLVF